MDLFSLEFLLFLSITLTAYYLLFGINKLLKKTIVPQWFVLCVASLVFYGFSNYIYLVFIGVSSLVSYLAGIICRKGKEESNTENDNTYKIIIGDQLPNKKTKNNKSQKNINKAVTIGAIVLNVSILAVLKYFNFFTGSINSIFHLKLTIYNFIIPLGISFYTFSLIAYNVDCYKRITKAETNFLKFLLFVSYFPKVLQGPISSFDKLKEDGLFSEHSFINVDFLKSFYRISIGLIKKLAIANVLNLYVNASYSNISNTYGIWLFITSILYSIQLYCDFSGFLDISIGISGLFGIRLAENFDIPYISSSVQEFWRRWHITLGEFLKKYIYIPLGGSRVSVWRWAVNTLIVWLVSGIWHGASWTFVLWGFYHGVLLVIFGVSTQVKKVKGIKKEKKPDGKPLKITKICITFLLVNFGWILFRSSNIYECAHFLNHMAQFWKNGTYKLFADSSLAEMNWLLGVSIALIIALIAIKIFTNNKLFLLSKMKNPIVFVMVAKYSVTVFFFAFSFFSLIYLHSIGEGHSSFIYFDF